MLSLLSGNQSDPRFRVSENQRLLLFGNAACGDAGNKRSAGSDEARLAFEVLSDCGAPPSGACQTHPFTDHAMSSTSYPANANGNGTKKFKLSPNVANFPRGGEERPWRFVYER
jgi:hypothetical protein